MQLSATIRRSPFFKFLVFFMSGIITAIISGNSLNIVWLIVPALGSMLLYIWFCRNPGFDTGVKSGIAAALLLFLCGIFSMSIRFRSADHIAKNEVFSDYAILDISEPVTVSGKSVRTTAQIKFRKHKGQWIRSKQYILVSFAIDSNSVRLIPGNRIVCNVKLTNIAGPANPGEFDYKKYMAARGIFNRSYLSSGNWKLMSFQHSRSLKSLAFGMQKRLLDKYREIGLNHTLYGLLSAITLGYKSDLEAQTKQIFAGAGVMHIMALSGFNVAVIAFVLGYLLFFTNWFKAGKFTKTFVVIGVIWLFAFVTGLSPSVTRAAVMISFVLTGTLLKRRISTGNILFISAFLLLAFSPLLIVDVSFQLSFAAVFGIVVFEPPIYHLITLRNKIADKLWQLFTVSCAAQLATLPLTVYYFHQFPVYFWLTNLYVVPLVSVIICVAGFYLIFSFWPALSMLTGKILALLLGLLYKSVAVTGILPGSQIVNIYLSSSGALILALLIITTAIYLLSRRRFLVFASLFLIVIFLAVGTVHQYKIQRQDMILIGNMRGLSIAQVIRGKHGIVFCSDLKQADESSMNYHFANFWIRAGIAGNIHLMEDTVKKFGYQRTWLGRNKLFKTGAGSVMILYEDLSAYKSGNPIALDLVVVTNGVTPDINRILHLLKPRVLVVDSSVSPSRRKYWKQSCKEKDVRCHVIFEDGAFLLAAE